MKSNNTSTSNTDDWSVPDANGNINVPDELYPLFNKLGFQFRFVLLSGKNEILAIAHAVQIAHKFFSENPHLVLSTTPEVQATAAYRWVKASERQSKDMVSTPCRLSGVDIVFNAFYDSDAGCYIDTKTARRVAPFDQIEWLEEVPATQPAEKQLAIGFADWVSIIAFNKYEAKHIQDIEIRVYEWLVDTDLKVVTTSELYDLYLQVLKTK